MRNMLKTLKEISINVLIQNFLKNSFCCFLEFMFEKINPYLLLAMTICEVLKFDFWPTLFKAESQTFWFEDQILFILCFDKKKPVLKLLSLERVRRKLIIKCGHSKIFSGSNMYSTATVNKYTIAAFEYVSYTLCCYLVLALERINKVYNLNNLVMSKCCCRFWLQGEFSSWFL